MSQLAWNKTLFNSERARLLPDFFFFIVGIIGIIDEDIQHIQDTQHTQ